MRIIRKPGLMQKLAAQWKRAGQPIAFVPTMGFLHAGHVSLIHRARKLAPRGVVVVSIYVNPAQFAPSEDLAKYPRDLPADIKLCQAAGANVLFAPSDDDMYPRAQAPEFSTYVVEERLSKSMEGASRPTHFRGVTTVVAKLFHLVQPDAAVFGAKDFQQAAVVRQMTRDLNFPIRIVVAPTIREADGLAMSSRNKYLSPEERKEATVLSHALKLARRMARKQASGAPVEEVRRTVQGLIGRARNARLDYVEVFDPVTLQPQATAKKGDQMALAVFLGSTRLIDNGRL